MELSRLDPALPPEDPEKERLLKEIELQVRVCMINDPLESNYRWGGYVVIVVVSPHPGLWEACSCFFPLLVLLRTQTPWSYPLPQSYRYPQGQPRPPPSARTPAIAPSSCYVCTAGFIVEDNIAASFRLLKPVFPYNPDERNEAFPFWPLFSPISFGLTPTALKPRAHLYL